MTMLPQRLKILFLICASLLAFTGGAAAECSEEDAANKLVHNLPFRQSLLERDQIKKTLFFEAAGPMIEKLDKLERRMQSGETDKQETLNLICRDLDRMISIADDILSGGDGTGRYLLTPWKNHTPEEMFRLQLEYGKKCLEPGNAICGAHVEKELEKETLSLLEMLQNGRIQYPAYVDGMTEALQKTLNNIK